MTRREEIRKILLTYEGEHINTKNMMFFVDTLNEYFERELQPLKDWIKKADHQDGCAWSRKLPLYKTCNCNKKELES